MQYWHCLADHQSKSRHICPAIKWDQNWIKQPKKSKSFFKSQSRWPPNCSGSRIHSCNLTFEPPKIKCSTASEGNNQDIKHISLIKESWYPNYKLFHRQHKAVLHLVQVENSESGIEVIHGMFRGRTTSLPITSPNLSFVEFLARTNKAAQIHCTEQFHQIKGNTIVASKKKRQTSSANEQLCASYSKPTTCDVTHWVEWSLQWGWPRCKICHWRSRSWKWLQKKHKEWAGPKVALLLFPTRVLSQFEEKDIDVLVQQLITSRLGPIPEADDQGSEEYHHALAISARSISTMYNQPYARKRKFSKRKPSTLRPKIARQCNNRSIDRSIDSV